MSSDDGLSEKDLFGRSYETDDDDDFSPVTKRREVTISRTRMVVICRNVCMWDLGNRISLLTISATRTSPSEGFRIENAKFEFEDMGVPSINSELSKLKNQGVGVTLSPLNAGKTTCSFQLPVCIQANGTVGDESCAISLILRVVGDEEAGDDGLEENYALREWDLLKREK